MKKPVKRITIGELERLGAIVEIQDGNHGELHPKSADYTEEGVPFIMANNFVGNVVDVANTHKLPDALAEQLRIGFAVDGDVLLTHKGTIGNTAIVQGASPYWMLTPQVTYYRVDSEKLSNRYLMYAFQEPAFKATMKSRADQATRPYIGIQAQRNLSIIYRPNDEQKRIVELLTPYDDLLMCNQRRIELLERSARLLFEEWFVRLRYPGHEHDQIVDGCPEGWSRQPLSKVVTINPRERVPKNNELWCVPMASLSESGMLLDETYFERRTKHTTVKFRNGDTLFARITPCLENGKTGYVDFLGDGEVACGSTEFIVMRGAAVPPEFTYCLARQDYVRGRAIKSMIGSSGRQRVQESCFDDLLVSVPPQALMSEFQDFSTGCFMQIKNLRQQNQKLERARDLLLPRLMDGRIAV